MTTSHSSSASSLSSCAQAKVAPTVRCRMSVKEWVHRMRPARLVIVLILSIIYFLVLLVFSHITHALTLLVQCYHMVCNIIALIGSLVMVKHAKNHSHHHHHHQKQQHQHQQGKAAKEGVRLKDSAGEPSSSHDASAVAPPSGGDGSLKNTFGWARIDVLTMLIMCIFMASLCFSLLVEAVRKLLHISHQDAMHFPLIVMAIGAAGLLLNGLAYLLIGGYTHNQITFLQVSNRPRRKGPRAIEVTRDLCSNVFILVCAPAVHFVTDQNVAKFIDPVVAIVSCVLLFSLSYPYMRESGLILLQTIPGSIDIAIFKEKLLQTFPSIYNVHDLHIWQLTAKKYVSTAHPIFSNEQAYETVIRAIEQFFHDQGICIVTIQPEFLAPDGKVIGGEEPIVADTGNCLMNCSNPECKEKACCNLDSERNLCREDPVIQVPAITVDEAPADKSS